MQSKSSSLQHVPSMGHIPEHDSTSAAAQQPAPELGVNGAAVQRLAETQPAVESQATLKPKVSGGGWGMVRPGLKRTKSDASKQPDPEMGIKPEGNSAPAETTPLKRSLSNNGGWGALRRHSSSMDANEDSANGLTRNSLFSIVKEVTATRDKEESVRRGMEYQKSLKQAKESSNEARQKAATALSAMPSTQIMSTKKRRRVEGSMLPRYIIHPYSFNYHMWLWLTCAAAIWTGIYIPFAIAFQRVPGLYPYDDGNAIYGYIFMVIFGIDMCISFRVAYIENDILVTDAKEIAKRYLKLRFIVDMFAWFPFDWIVLGAFDASVSDNFHRWIGLIQLLRLLRLYRIMVLFKGLELKVSISLMWVTLTRNFTVAFFICHFAACIFYFIARQYGFSDTTWIGANAAEVLDGKSTFLRYIWAYYWAIITFATVGYGDLHAYNEVEAAFIIIFVFLNIVINAWIVGTITLLIIRHDERTGRYRSQSGILQHYTRMNQLPEELHTAMESHLRLHFNNESSSDDSVLAIYPTPLRRRILTFLYVQKLKQCYLFHDCTQKLLDAFLGAAQVHLYMPKVEVVSMLDHVNELYIVVGGVLEAWSSAENHDDVTIAIDEHNGTTKKMFPYRDLANRSMHGGAPSTTSRKVEAGDCFGEIAFFTEAPQLETVRTVSVCRIMAVPRAAYNNMKSAFPIGTRKMLSNLAEEAVRACENVGLDQDQLIVTGKGGDLVYGSAEAVESARKAVKVPPVSPFADGATNGDDTAMGGTRALKRMSITQQQARANLERVRNLVTQHTAKHDEDRTTTFLYAATRGDVALIRQMLQQGFQPNQADYDGRTALHLAAVKGNLEVIQVLANAVQQTPGATLSPPDAAKNTPLSEACTWAQDKALDLLKQLGAQLGRTGTAAAAALCDCIFEGDLKLMARLLKAGADVNAGDYDKRTPLHIAAAEVNLTAVKMLIEKGKADINVKDRWGQTPLDEAIRNRATKVAEYLQSRRAKQTQQ